MYKLLFLALYLTIISCDKDDTKTRYESDKIIITYEKSNNIFSEKLISLQFGSKDTLLKSKNYSFKDVNDLIRKSLGKPITEQDYLEAGKYDLLIIKKDSLLKSDNVYKEFENFLKNEKFVEINPKQKR